jgi:hypothetical protein
MNFGLAHLLTPFPGPVKDNLNYFTASTLRLSRSAP